MPNAARASETLALADQLQAVPEQAFETGAFGEARGFLSRLTELMGADPQAVPGLGSGGAIDLIQSSSNQLTVQLMSRIKGNLNETEVNIVRRSVPGLLMTPEGNKILSRIMRRSAERSRKRLSMAEDYIRKHGGLRAPDKDVPSFQQKWIDYTRDNPVINEDLRRTIGGLTGKAVKRFVPEVPDDATNVERLQNSQVFGGEDGRRTTVPAGSIRYKINGEWKWIPPSE